MFLVGLVAEAFQSRRIRARRKACVGQFFPADPDVLIRVDELFQAAVSLLVLSRGTYVP